jgi:hypothetical protein
MDELRILMLWVMVHVSVECNNWCAMLNASHEQNWIQRTS